MNFIFSGQLLLALAVFAIWVLMNLIFFALFFRMKVDLTKYIEEHIFSFDNAYPHEADN